MRHKRPLLLKLLFPESSVQAHSQDADWEDKNVLEKKGHPGFDLYVQLDLLKFSLKSELKNWRTWLTWVTENLHIETRCTCNRENHPLEVSEESVQEHGGDWQGPDPGRGPHVQYSCTYIRLQSEETAPSSGSGGLLCTVGRVQRENLHVQLWFKGPPAWLDRDRSSVCVSSPSARNYFRPSSQMELNLEWFSSSCGH